VRLLVTLIVQNIPVYIFVIASISIEEFALLEYVTAYVGARLPTYAAKTYQKSEILSYTSVEA
jgi:hypothetical protein